MARTCSTTASWRPSFLLSSATGEVRIAEKLLPGFNLCPSLTIKQAFDLILNCQMRATLYFTTLIVFCCYIKIVWKDVGCFAIDSSVVWGLTSRRFMPRPAEGLALFSKECARLAFVWLQLLIKFINNFSELFSLVNKSVTGYIARWSFLLALA